MSLPVENIADRHVDRSAQVLQLLQELSDRLRRSENERDMLKRELGSIRDMMQDLDDRNSQTQKAYLALENKIDGTDNTVDSVIRRLTGMEDSVDKQSTEMLAILRKIEERFQAYDREYKNHSSNITHFGEQLERFDKRLEKLTQDKGRLTRKIDALEFQLTDTEEKLKSAIVNAGASMDAVTAEGVAAAAAARAGLQVWTPSDARPQFMSGPAEIPVPRMQWLKIRPEVLTRVGQGVAIAALVLMLGALGYGIVNTLLHHPGKVSGTTDVAAVAPAAVTPVPAASEKPAVVAVNAVPVKDFFSKSVRQQIDQQMVVARKLEDDETAALMTTEDKSPTNRRMSPDTSLPRAIKAIEAKAAEGTAEAQHDMGALYTSGQSGVNVDYTRAAFWFREAAYNGVANARYNLGVLYQQGLGVEKDIDQALSWYRASALLNHPEARYNLGIAYVEGIGANYNPAMAAGYFEQAAKSGVIEAAYNLGLILENGLIDEPRPFEGLFWYKLAADRGSKDGADAQKRLQAELKLDDAQWTELFNKMLAERPELKALADSKAVTVNTEPPRVRIHTPADVRNEDAPNTARKINDIIPAPTKAKVEKTASTSKGIMTAPPPAPMSPDAANSSITMAPDQTVARIQAMLADDGMFPAAPTGEYGPVTADAIRRYQMKYDLPVDGQPSQGLLANMLARRLAITSQPAAGGDTKKTPAHTSHEVNE